MGRISSLFEKKRTGILNVYCTAGYPELESTVPVIKALQESGADLVEIGIPYSDPLADGPVIQASSTQALKNGMTLDKLFKQLKGFRKDITVPVVLMGYMNPVLQYGFEKFCSDAASVGIDGLILPDLPAREFENEYSGVLAKYKLDFIFLVTPETANERMIKLDSLSSGFLYAVSSSSTTGSAQDQEEVRTYLQRLKSLPLKNPVLLGFGIRDKASFDQACQYVNGAIIGTAYIKAIGEKDDLASQTRTFLAAIRN